MLAQRGHEGEQRGGPREGHEVGSGHIPARGPEPAREAHPVEHAPDRRVFVDRPGHPQAPHVHVQDDRWIGHDTGRVDAHYHIDHPWEHGHFPGELGAHRIWRLGGGGPSRFRFGGYYFSVPLSDVVYVGDWFGATEDMVL